MKKKYTVLKRIIIVEILVIIVTEHMGIYFKDYIGEVITTWLALSPLLCLLFIARKDTNLSKRKRGWCNFFFGFLMVDCTIVSIIKLIEWVSTFGVS